MSAQIPETMLLSDLLKATGYDCPEEAIGKTMAEVISGGDAKISTNTDAEIDVSAYTEPVEVEPAEGYDATKKVTVELKNIPAGVTKLYAWAGYGGAGGYVYTTKDITGGVAVGDDAYKAKNDGSAISILKVAVVGESTISVQSGSATPVEVTRDSTKDITF